MCHACIANMTLIAAGAGSTGGLAAFAMKQIFFKSRPKTSNKRNWRKTK
jgi:hypothetical protein